METFTESEVFVDNPQYPDQRRRGSGRLKDGMIDPNRYTYDLVQEANEFGINAHMANQVDPVRVCGVISGRDGADKYQQAGVTSLKGTIIQSCLVVERPLNLECEVVYKIDYKGTHQWFMGEVSGIHIDEDCDHTLLDGNRVYHKVGEFLARYLVGDGNKPVAGTGGS